MKSSKLLLVLWLGTSAWAQTQPQKQQVNPPVVAKPNAPVTATPSASSPKAPAPATTTKTTTPVAPRSGVGAATKQQSAKPTAQSSKKQGKGAEQSTSSKATQAKGGNPMPAGSKSRRDPFVSPVVERIRTAASCNGSGRQCLVIGEISLHGVVHSPSGYIAVVMNGEHTYFLRENDPLADGSVERITRDAIILRERSSDAVGRSVTREVTKKLGAPPI